MFTAPIYPTWPMHLAATLLASIHNTDPEILFAWGVLGALVTGFLLAPLVAIPLARRHALRSADPKRLAEYTGIALLFMLGFPVAPENWVISLHPALPLLILGLCAPALVAYTLTVLYVSRSRMRACTTT